MSDRHAYYSLDKSVAACVCYPDAGSVKGDCNGERPHAEVPMTVPSLTRSLVHIVANGIRHQTFRPVIDHGQRFRPTVNVPRIAPSLARSLVTELDPKICGPYVRSSKSHMQ